MLLFAIIIIKIKLNEKAIEDIKRLLRILQKGTISFEP